MNPVSGILHFLQVNCPLSAHIPFAVLLDCLQTTCWSLQLVRGASPPLLALQNASRTLPWNVQHDLIFKARFTRLFYSQPYLTRLEELAREILLGFTFPKQSGGGSMGWGLGVQLLRCGIVSWEHADQAEQNHVGRLFLEGNNVCLHVETHSVVMPHVSYPRCLRLLTQLIAVPIGRTNQELMSTPQSVCLLKLD